MDELTVDDLIMLVGHKEVQILALSRANQKLQEDLDMANALAQPSVVTEGKKPAAPPENPSNHS